MFTFLDDTVEDKSTKHWPRSPDNLKLCLNKHIPVTVKKLTALSEWA
jgi:hypothetical protein